MHNAKLFYKAQDIINDMYGNNAAFRSGQFESIQTVMENKRTLLVQKTGWGKSLIYFTCASLLKSQGTTMVISPLLALMENQLNAAKRAGLSCDMLNSTTFDRREEIFHSLTKGEIDIIFVTPETIFKGDFLGYLPSIKISLLVIDEAHCISDWGHDFRLEYTNIHKILKDLPDNVKLLATTATANNRVVEDICEQLGGDVYVLRGGLLRETLAIQMLPIKSKEERMGWLLENVPKLSGSGIIYCLTKRDCDYISDFLNQNGITARPYYSGLTNYELDETQRSFYKNKIKVIVATVKLGMGYDKDDISFVIHYQQPANIVAYYQQIGRAGRGIEKAYAFLMCGDEDEKILDYFIESAFPTEKESLSVMEVLKKRDGLSLRLIEPLVNLRRGRLEKTLAFLVNEGFLTKGKTNYFITDKPFEYNHEHYEQLRRIRQEEKSRMQGLITTNECYGKYTVNYLDDLTSKNCGVCSNCINKNILPCTPSPQYVKTALEYLDGLNVTFAPRLMWPDGTMTSKSKIEFVNEDGLCLCSINDPGFGVQVKKGIAKDYFDDALVGKSCDLLKPLILQNKITAIACVPSTRHCVKDFAQRLSLSCKIEFIDVLKKSGKNRQQDMNNSTFQCENALRYYKSTVDNTSHKNILLIDDTVASRWSMTVCGYILKEIGCEKVFPFALAKE